MAFCGLRIQTKSLPNCAPCCRRHLVRSNVARKHKYHKSIDQPGMGQTKRGIKLTCPLEICRGFLRIEQIKLRVVVTATEIQIVGLRVSRGIPDELTPVF